MADTARAEDHQCGIRLVELLEAHAEASLAKSPTNARYSERVLRNAAALRVLLSSNEGEVLGVVGTWFSDFRPIAEEVFGEPIGDDAGMELPNLYGDYADTTIPGIQGRIGRISLDEI